MLEATCNMIRPLVHLRRAYCAGPLFNEAERREMTQIADVLQAAGFETFLPHADGMEFAQVHPFLVAQGHDAASIGQMLHQAIFALDVYQVAVGCGSIVMNLNGRVPDEGAVSETAIAWTLGKPIVIFKEDARSAIESRDNPLIAGLAEFQMISRLDQLGHALSEVIAAHPLSSDWQTNCPPLLQTAITQGETLSKHLEALGDHRPADEVATIVFKLFADPQNVPQTG